MGTDTYTENQHHHHHKNLYHHQRNGNPAASSSSTNKTFIPILCRVSVKDTIAAHHPRTICPRKDEPSSPRVSCMGQVKHHHHHRLTPSSTTSTVKHHHRIVPAKSRNSSTKCNQAILIDPRRRRRQLCTKFSDHDKNVHDNNSCAAVVPVLNLAELDPPLPVIKRLPQPCDSQTVSLWKRRSRGDGLANIQIPAFPPSNLA